MPVTTTIFFTMTRRLLPGFVVLAGLLLGSCYPVDEHPQRRPAPRMKAGPLPVAHNGQIVNPTRQEQPATPATTPSIPTQPHPQPTATQPVTARPTAAPRRKPPPEPPTKDVASETSGRKYPVAKKAPGRDGYVLSPYTSKLMNVRGIPRGTVVPDQTSPDSPQKSFIVP